jgi:seryl-tRNA synthetase
LHLLENQEKVVQSFSKKKNMGCQDGKGSSQLDEKKRRATQVELDNILAESNKLSKDIGELMKSGEKAKRRF